MPERLTRKTLAVAILAAFAGVTLEAQLPDGKMWRAPLTGVAVVAAAAALAWAESELKGDRDARAD